MAVQDNDTPVTPTMEAGIARRPFDVSDLVNLLIEAESKKAA